MGAGDGEDIGAFRGRGWVRGQRPHPTPLRGAAFSHKWEKEETPIEFNFDNLNYKAAPFSHLWEKVALASARVG